MSECDWHRLWPPEGERKCDNPPAVVRDGYGGSRNVRFCAGHDPLGGSMSEGKITDRLGEHLTEDGQFQSDKYPWCEPDFVPLKVTDPDAADLLAMYAMRRARKDAIFAADLLARLGDPRINR